MFSGVKGYLRSLRFIREWSRPRGELICDEVSLDAAGGPRAATRLRPRSDGPRPSWIDQL